MSSLAAFEERMSQIGTPTNWLCPDCGVTFILYPELPFDKENHNCAKKRREGPVECPCWWRLRDHMRVESFVVYGLVDPDGLTVETLAPDGSTQVWQRRRENGLDVFYPPKNYRDADFFNGPNSAGAVMRPGPHQVLKLVPRPMQELLATNHQVSVDLGKRG